MRRRYRCRCWQVSGTFEMTISGIKFSNDRSKARCDLQRIRAYGKFDCEPLTSFVRAVPSRLRSRSPSNRSGTLPATSPVERKVRSRNFRVIEAIEQRIKNPETINKELENFSGNLPRNQFKWNSFSRPSPPIVSTSATR